MFPGAEGMPLPRPTNVTTASAATIPRESPAANIAAHAVSMGTGHEATVQASNGSAWAGARTPTRPRVNVSSAWSARRSSDGQPRPLARPVALRLHLVAQRGARPHSARSALDGPVPVEDVHVLAVAAHRGADRAPAPREPSLARGGCLRDVPPCPGADAGGPGPRVRGRPLAFQLRPNPYAYFNTGLAYVQLHRYPEALEAFDEGLRLADEVPVVTLAAVHSNRAGVHLLLERPQAALEDLAQAVELDPGRAQ
jgi:tetratricopeptide repeat protein